jgi:putative DNA primase/helicase
MTTTSTGPTTEHLAKIPDDLKALPQWVLWRGEDRIDQRTGAVKLNKIPIDQQTLRNADTTNPTTWGTFVRCVAALPVALEEWAYERGSAYRGGGIGYVFTKDDPFAGVDLDRCVDPVTGAIEAWAQGHIDALASYTEITPSGTGIHVIVEGTLPPRGRKRGAVELYDRARFFTMTGWHVPSTPHAIEARQEALAAFHATVFGPVHMRQEGGTSAEESTQPLMKNAVLFRKARTAKNGDKFKALWTGNITEYDSPSNADLALCNLLAFWTRSAKQIDRLFRHSKLMRDKWDAKRGEQTYGARTIAEALARQTEHYTPDDGAKLIVKKGSQPQHSPPRADIAYHVLPAHLRDHPDPRVRRHWARVYQKANALKRAMAAQGALR